MIPDTRGNIEDRLRRALARRGWSLWDPRGQKDHEALAGDVGVSWRYARWILTVMRRMDPSNPRRGRKVNA